MQLVRLPLFASALASGWAATGPRSLRAAAPARSGKAVQQEQLIAEPVFVVDVPVMVVVDDGDGDAETPEGQVQVSGPCQQEMAAALQKNQSFLVAAAACEDSANFTRKAVASLRAANETGALLYTGEAYTQCMHISEGCAHEMAPVVVMKLRFSGVAITEECGRKANQNPPADTSGDCEEGGSREMAVHLQRQNMTGAISAAEVALSRCIHIHAPCDFQLAPLLVMRVMQFMQQRQMQAALQDGLREAVQFQAKLMRSMMRHASSAAAAAPHANATPVQSSQAASKMKKATPTMKKALSLLVLAQRSHLSSVSHTIAL